MHYTPSVDLAFVSVEHIMRDVNFGWLIRYLHANTASFFFIFVYLHIGRGLYYGSYKSPRTLVWSIGVVILILIIAIAFLGYVLPYGQMSLWGILFCPKCIVIDMCVYISIVFILVILKNFSYAKRLPSHARTGPHNKIILEIIYGSLLGDSHAERRVLGNGTRICFYQESIHKEYLLWLHNIIINMGYCNQTIPKIQTRLSKKVITNLLSAIPWIGQDFVEFVWGGFSVNNATLNRFFSLHYLLPFVLAALTAIHLLTLHEHGSSNPLGLSGNTDRLVFHPYFTFKDLVTIFVFVGAVGIFLFYMPNVLGHSDNYIPANPMQTPASIVPEWYLLPFYAILRAIPNKLLGVLAMFMSLLILLFIPIVDISRVRGSQSRPLIQIAFYALVVDFFILMFVGSQHVESPYTEIGAFATAFYFGWFLIIVPVIGIIENTIIARKSVSVLNIIE
ncbi:UNVERIFIED_CONTAM: Cytochrome b [Trichonephila clavipes]